MDVENVVNWIRSLYVIKERIQSERDRLLKDFHEEFPAVKKSKGWMLVGKSCGKAGCTECPHKIYWRWYQRDVGKPVWGKRWYLVLPKSFWHSWREEDTKERFQYYEEEATRINGELKKIQSCLKSIKAKAKATYDSLG